MRIWFANNFLRSPVNISFDARIDFQIYLNFVQEIFSLIFNEIKKC